MPAVVVFVYAVVSAVMFRSGLRDRGGWIALARTFRKRDVAEEWKPLTRIERTWFLMVPICGVVAGSALTCALLMAAE